MGRREGGQQWARFRGIELRRGRMWAAARLSFMAVILTTGRRGSLAEFSTQTNKREKTTGDRPLLAGPGRRSPSRPRTADEKDDQRTRSALGADAGVERD